MLIHFSLTLFLCLLNLIPLSIPVRKNFILPLSFIMIGIFMGVRYNYGLDYWNYYDEFYNYQNYRPNESLFWLFFFSFEKYYQFILVKSLLLSAILLYIVRKYVPVQYYVLFIFFFMVNSSLIYSMITAERTCLGAMVLWCGLEFFYFRKKRYILLVGSIIVASLFHTILLSMLIIPFFILFFSSKRLHSSKTILLLLCIVLMLGMTLSSALFEYLSNKIEDFSSYAYYADERFGNANIVGTLFKGLLLIPLYYIIQPLNKLSSNSIYFKMTILSLVYPFIYFVGLETDGRIGLITLPFFVITMLQRASQLNSKLKILIMISPFFLMTVYNNILLYMRMIKEPLLEGNYLIYQTIFDVGFFN